MTYLHYQLVYVNLNHLTSNIILKYAHTYQSKTKRKILKNRKYLIGYEIYLNTKGVLYVLENGTTINSFADLAGKKLYATGQGSTPEYILNYLLEKNGIADKVTVQLLNTDPNVNPKDAIAKKAEKKGLWAAMDIGSVWLERALANA